MTAYQPEWVLYYVCRRVIFAAQQQALTTYVMKAKNFHPDHSLLRQGIAICKSPVDIELYIDVTIHIKCSVLCLHEHPV